MKTAALAFVLVLSSAAFLPAQSAAPAGAKHKVVLQMNVANDESWNQLFGNIGNLQKAFGKDNVQIEVVFYGKGIMALLKTDTVFQDRMKEAAASGVVLAACQNSMRQRKIKSEDIFSFSTEVDSGAAELVRKQEAGFSYIRAGE